MDKQPSAARGMQHPSDEQKVVVEGGLLALLHQEADSVRAELGVLREELARVKENIGATHSAQLLEANEQLVLAALRAQAVADSARRRLRPTRGTASTSTSAGSGITPAESSATGARISSTPRNGRTTPSAVVRWKWRAPARIGPAGYTTR